jgi:hypothetical protein
MSDGPDDVKDSFYLHIMRISIGSALREHYHVNEVLPERWAELLKELDEPAEDSEPISRMDNGNAS